jgi:selenocysteine lyase/cysteine desulfurase
VIQPVEPNFGLQPDQLEAAFIKHPNVKVVAISWVNFYNGYRHDLKALAEIAHQHGAYLIADIIQGLGTRPLDVRALGIDIATASVHKWLLCPVGLGFVWCRKEIQADLDTPWGGWLSIDWQSDYSDLFGTDRVMADGPRRAEVGTVNFSGVRAVAEVVSWIRDLGTDRIAAHTQNLLDYIAQEIDPRRYTIISDRSPDHRSSIFCIRPHHGDADQLRRHLASSGIATAVREGALRLSPHFRNTLAEMEHLMAGLRTFG